MKTETHSKSTLLREYHALDGYRFLAAALVAIGHFNMGFQLGIEKLTPLADRFSLFVDFFFILSGFVIALNYSSKITSLAAYGDYIWRRFARLWPLHVAVLIFFGSVGLIGVLAGHNFNHPDAIKPSAVPWNLMLLHAWGPVWHESFNVASWSISAEMFVYALFPLMAWQVNSWQVSSGKGRWLPYIISLTLIITFVVILVTVRNWAGLRPWNQATYDLGALRAVPTFMLGVVIHRFAKQETGMQWVNWPMAHGLFVTALILTHFYAPAELVIATFGLFILAAIKAEENESNTWLSGEICQNFGQASYALYMVHMPMMTCGMLIARRTTGLGGWGGWAFATVILLCALVLALWLFKGFEDPSRRKLNALSPFTAKRESRKILTPAE
jgi:peptidoglycan/LPS O-acetylase OafA/YrhL